MAATGEGVLARMGEGLQAVRRSPRLRGTLVVTILFNIFPGWPFTSLVPVVAQHRYGLGPEATGMLASMDGVGAFAGALLMAALARPAWYARLYLGGLTLYLVMVTGFAVAPNATVAGAALLLVGFGQSGFSIMQATLVYLLAPAEVRMRVLGLLSVCIGLGPIGFLALGLAADALGATMACALTGGDFSWCFLKSAASQIAASAPRLMVLRGSRRDTIVRNPMPGAAASAPAKNVTAGLVRSTRIACSYCRVSSPWSICQSMQAPGRNSTRSMSPNSMPPIDSPRCAMRFSMLVSSGHEATYGACIHFSPRHCRTGQTSAPCSGALKRPRRVRSEPTNSNVSRCAAARNALTPSARWRGRARPGRPAGLAGSCSSPVERL